MLVWVSMLIYEVEEVDFLDRLVEELLVVFDSLDANEAVVGGVLALVN